MARVVVKDLILEALDQLRPLRAGAHKAHLPGQHIQELGKLVDVPPPHERSHPEPAGVIACRPHGAGFGLGVEAHAADLVDIERPAASAHPELAVEYRPGRLGEHNQPKECYDREREDEADQASDNVDEPFRDAVKGLVERQLHHP